MKLLRILPCSAAAIALLASGCAVAPIHPADTAQPAPVQSVAMAAGWADVPAILARIKAPEFLARDFPITAYGAVADGATDCTAAIQQAIEACHAAGGGRVVVPAGVFLTGAVHLKSNVNLHVAEGATLRFSPDPASYLPVVVTRFEGTECMNYSPLIYAYEQENIAVTGPGTLDGSAALDNWWGWTKRGTGPAKATPASAGCRITAIAMCPSRSASSAPTIFSAPISSSPTVAATC